MRLVQLAAREARKADAVNNETSETASPFCNPLSSLLRGVALVRCW
jgi:hypothetical protein